MNKTSRLYPLKFTPILKEKVWGGRKLVTLFQKDGTGLLGESWEISGVEGAISKVSNGMLQGQALTEVLSMYKENLVGKKVYTHFGNEFPLLFKFIDAHEALSVQLHPGDTLAKERHNSFGKTEMWYIMEAAPGAEIILGFNKPMDQKIYAKELSHNQLAGILHREKVTKGDSFFIAPGTVHAIGAGVVLAEIQQTSDITYRIYDWDRPDTDGKLRQLHTEEALDAIDYGKPDAKLEYSDKRNIRVLLKSTPYFETNTLQLTQEYMPDLATIDSFVVYMCVEGTAELHSEGFSEKLTKGETILIPATLRKLYFKTNHATLLEIYIP